MRMTRGEFQAFTHKEKAPKSISHANRGQVLEEIINLTNISYRRHGRAIINKVPTEWIPIRGENGKIISAKVDKKSTVDYVGRYGRTPIAFDAKETHEARMRWDRIEQHQEQFLKEWSKDGCGIGFVLVSFGEKETFVIPWYEWEARLETYRSGGAASFKAVDIPPGWAVEKYDYLKTIESMRIYWRINS